MQPRRIGRYVIYDRIASGGMASVHFGRLQAGGSFSRTVAVKELHPQFSQDPEFRTMFLDEARIASRIQHPNVVVPLDVVVLNNSGEIFLVMEYVQGETLARLVRAAAARKTSAPAAVAAAIVSGALRGLHAAHEAKDEVGRSLEVVHRDISPQNILVGLDGVPRVLDFGIAKAISGAQSTRDGHFKGKLPYMSPEQMRSAPVDRRADIFAAGIVFWEVLTHKRLFSADDPAGTVALVLNSPIPKPSSLNPALSPAIDWVVMKALERDVDLRYETANEFALAIEENLEIASTRRTGEWVADVGEQALTERARILSRIESQSVNEVFTAAGAEPDDEPDDDGQEQAEQTPPGLLLNTPPTAPIEGQDPAEIDVALPSTITPWLAGVDHAGLPGESNISDIGRGELQSPELPAARPWAAAKRPALAILAGAALIGTFGVGRWLAMGHADESPLPPREAPGIPALQLSGGPAPADPTPTTPRAPPAVGDLRVVPDGRDIERLPPAIPRGVVSPGPTTAAQPALESPNAKRQRPGKTKRLVRQRAPSKTGTDAACVPPYTIDSEGIRRVKPGCL